MLEDNMENRNCGCNCNCECGCNNDEMDCACKNELREEMMMQLRAYKFSIIELALYLDTHPDDEKALCLHRDYAKKARDLSDKYQKMFGPLTINYPCKKWRWLEEPWPSFRLGVKLLIYEFILTFYIKLCIIKIVTKSSTYNHYTLNKERDNNMKRIEEKVVPENADIVETIIQLAEENEAWIYLSHSLMSRLRESYFHYYYANRENGEIFEVDSSFDGKLFVDFGNAWNQVKGIPKKDVYIAFNPDVIYFLS